MMPYPYISNRLMVKQGRTNHSSSDLTYLVSIKHKVTPLVLLQQAVDLLFSQNEYNTPYLLSGARQSEYRQILGIVGKSAMNLY